MGEVISFAKMLIKSFFDFLEMIPKAVSTLTELVGSLPSIVVAVCMAAVGILITYAILGRGS